MMHVEDGDKHSFWADNLPAGLSVVRQFDIVVLAIWIISLIAYAVASYYFSDDYDGYYLLSFIAIPFAIVGLVYIIDRKNLALLIGLILVSVAIYIVFEEILYVLLLVYLFVGALGVSCVVDAIQRCMFYNVVGHIRYVNVKEHLSIGDRFYSFMFNVPPDLDTRNITICPRKLGNKFPWKEMGSTVWLSMTIGMFFWIYLSMNPAFMDTDSSITGDVPLFIFGLTLYVPVIVLPFSVFKSLDVKIGTNYRDFKLYNGIMATIQRMAIPIFAALMYVFLQISEHPVEVLMFIGFSAIIILFVVFLTSIIYYFTMEATASSDISKKWKLFIPVPLMMTLHDESENQKKEFPGTPVRDEEDMSQLHLSVKK